MLLQFRPLFGAVVIAGLALSVNAPRAEDAEVTPCTEDAMLVFDASGSMSGNGWGYGSENPTASRIDKVRLALSKVLPSITRFRRVGLITSAVEQAAEALDFRRKPGVVVLLTDGEETCGGLPCAVGKHLHDEAFQLTVHVIGLRVAGYTWTGEQSIFDVKCLVKENGGLYTTVETEEELIEALEKTLGCPLVTQRALP